MSDKTSGIKKLLDSNKAWAQESQDKDPGFFARLEKQQFPRYLWIGCSDSRVPANQITGLEPGEVFVHRNVANLVMSNDLNCLAVVEFAVKNLKVSDIIICGHYGCGGVQAALNPLSSGLTQNWIARIRDTLAKNYDSVMENMDSKTRINRLCELNVIQQVANLSQTSIIQEAWLDGHQLNIHGWIYALSDGLLKDLGVSVSSLDQVHEAFRVKRN